MSAAPVSVVIVSRGRPEALLRCLTGVSQLLYPNFEIVVVADPAGADAIAATGQAGRIKLVAFDEANISQARNLGIRAAAGEIVAFIDDDAVPEPTWLSHLTAPLADPAVKAAGGFVRGRNGISWQWQGRDIGADALSEPIPVNGSGPLVLAPEPDRGIKTEGTNMAFRRDVLAGMGGFDPAFRFYLDESDLNLRLAEAGGLTALVPLAQVHHGYAASDRRRPDRAPTDLHEVGASLAVFARKHGGDIARALAHHRKGVIGHMVAGRIEPQAVRRLLAGLRRGLEDGRARVLADLPAIGPAQGGFLRFHPAVAFAGHRHLAGRIWHLGRLREQAAQLAAAGHIVSVFAFSPTARPHRVRFDPAGYWLQTGGLFGQSDRAGRRFTAWLFAGRLRAELRRVSVVRGAFGVTRKDKLD